MWENITKKEFIDTLKTKNNSLLYTGMNLTNERFTKVINNIYNSEWTMIDSRKCKDIYTNHLTFDDGSNLYFNTLDRTYKHNNVIINMKEEYDIFDKDYKYSLIAYIVE